MSKPDSDKDKLGAATDIRFRTTRWTRIVEAQGQSPAAQTALSELCEHYYAPVEYFIEQRVGKDQGRDLAHSFFAKLLAKPNLKNATQQGTRFRSFLLGAVKHFLSDERDRQNALKRGGGERHVTLEAPSTTSPGFEIPDPTGPHAEQAFDRRWATTLLNRSLDRLQAAFAADGKEKQFEILKHWLPGETSMNREKACADLEMTEGAFKVAIHRLRQRFKKTVREEVAQTVADPADVTGEVRYLIEVLA